MTQLEPVLFGASGQLGHALAKRCSATALTRDTCDVTDGAQVEAVTPPDADLVINATAYNAVDRAEAEPQEAFDVNATAVALIARAARARGARFLHFSTDYVFGDGHTTPIDESHDPQPCSVYGRSKLLGERLAAANCSRTTVIRTTGLYSHRRQNFVRTMIRHGLRGTRLSVVNDQTISPTWVDAVAPVALELARLGVDGTYHVVSGGGCTWYELAGRVFELLDIPGDLHPTTQDAWGAAARRPFYSVLQSRLLPGLNIEPVGRWDDELERFLADHGAALIAELSEDA